MKTCLAIDSTLECAEVLAKSLRGEGKPRGIPMRFQSALKADSYYAVWVAPPSWVANAKFISQIDNLRFYKLGEVK